MITSNDNMIGWYCQPGKNIPRANDRNLECKR